MQPCCIHLLPYRSCGAERIFRHGDVGQVWNGHTSRVNCFAAAILLPEHTGNATSSLTIQKCSPRLEALRSEAKGLSLDPKGANRHWRELASFDSSLRENQWNAVLLICRRRNNDQSARCLHCRYSSGTSTCPFSHGSASCRSLRGEALLALNDLVNRKRSLVASHCMARKPRFIAMRTA